MNLVYMYMCIKLLFCFAAPKVAGPIAEPPPPYTMSAEDKTEPITGFKAVMVRTMTESGRLERIL